jgi:hypothetical protein
MGMERDVCWAEVRIEMRWDDFAFMTDDETTAWNQKENCGTSVAFWVLGS